MVDRLRRVPPLAWAMLFAGALVVPRLGASGFWDPWELTIADHAREIALSGSLLDPTVKGRFTAEPPLDLFLSAVGMKIFGTHEFGARCGNALCALGALLAVYWAGVGMFRRRAALLAALAMGTMPLFFMQSRQLVSDMPQILGLTLALGGLARFAWPAGGRRGPKDLAVAAAGMLIATMSGGALMGIALPCLTLAGAVIAGWSLAPSVAGVGGLCDPGIGPHVHADKSFGRGLLAARARGIVPVAVVGAVGLAVLILTFTTANVAGKYSLMLGGIPRGGTPDKMFEYLVRQIGFGIFPWSAVAVFALGRALIRLGDGQESDGGRLAFGQLFTLVFASFGFALATVVVWMTGDARFPALAALALALGVFFDEALEGERLEPILGLLAATGTLVVARDIFLGPEDLVSSHLLAKVKWPPALVIGNGVIGTGLLVGAGVYLGLATRGRAIGRVALRDLSEARPWRQKIEKSVVWLGRYGIQGAMGVAVIFAIAVVQGLVPKLSQHLSYKPVLESFDRFAQPGDEIGKYHVEGHGMGFYTAGRMTDLPTQERLVDFLRQPKRAFALVSADDLAALDSAFKGGQLPYFVVDASSSRFLLLSNRLDGGTEDKNPLTKNVWMAPHAPTVVAPPVNEPIVNIPQGGEAAARVAKPGQYDWRGQAPPWGKPTIAASAIFGGCIELLGADYPNSIRRPGKIPLVLHFRVQCRPPAGYKIFMHFDAPNEPRVLGDHAPLDGAFPTANWLPGEYIKDTTEVDVPLMTTPAGTYTLLVGFWPGGEGRRLAVTGGNTDGQDRARIGTIDIR